MIRVHFFSDNTFLGTSEMPPQIHLRAGQIERPCNKAYFCPACGDIWGRMVVKLEQDFAIRHRFCVHHGSGLFQDSGSPMWKYFPKEVLRRELKLIAQHSEHSPDLDFQDLLINWKRYYGNKE